MTSPIVPVALANVFSAPTASDALTSTEPPPVSTNVVMTLFCVESSACTHVLVVSVLPASVNVPVTSPWPRSSII